MQWSLIGVAIVGVALLSGYLSMRKAVRGGEVKVPSLLGIAVEEATGRLREKGLILDRSGERVDSVVPAGQIISQDPPEGARLKKNRKVHVLISLGQEVLLIPQLVGQPARRAQIGLQQSGLRVGEIAYVASDAAEADKVLAQEPPPGTQSGRDGHVDLLVSRGSRARTWVMPHLEGMDMALATRVLDQAGLRVTNVRREPRGDGTPAGIVLEQVPVAGYPLQEGESISLIVSDEEDHG
ncbi:MAG TPA: PASTA domain-containing protein [Candidatus Polarisedimenticolia bacterium]|nr:PASTA domain-containing protein [Candidatus Polarisedimenticolia bacterium]